MSRIKKPIPPRDVLVEKYSNTYGSTINQLCKQFNVSGPTLRTWLINYQIPIKDEKLIKQEANRRHLVRPTREQLFDDYQKYSIDALEIKYKVGQVTLYRWMDELEIVRLDQSNACSLRKQQTIIEQYPQELIEQSYERSVNIQDFANNIGCCYSKARRLLYKYEISIKQPKTSLGQLEVFNYCQAIAPDGKWELNNRSIISKEIDIYSPVYNIGIEFCGIIWHSENFGQKMPKYHLNKYLECASNNIQLLTIFDCEWYTSQSKIKNIIAAKLNKLPKLYGRNCHVEQLTYQQVVEFDNKFHIKNSKSGCSYFGLFHKSNELVMTMTVGRNRYSTENVDEIIRLTSGNYKVLGGFSKLLNHCNSSKLVSYCDLRYGNGDGYKAAGFQFVSLTPPGYQYFKTSEGDKLYSRVQFQKHKLSNVLKSFDPTATEWENMKNNNYDRIWDCGNSKWIYNKSK